MHLKHLPVVHTYILGEEREHKKNKAEEKKMCDVVVVVWCVVVAVVVVVKGRRGEGGRKRQHHTHATPQCTTTSLDYMEKTLHAPPVAHQSTTPPLEHGSSNESTGRSGAHGVKSTSPVTENHDKNGFGFQDNNKNFIMNNVDNSDTKYTNKNDTNNHNAHNLHK